MEDAVTDFAARMDRLESLEAIRQLPCRYARAVDGRDIDTRLGLFIDDVDCGKRGKGREALRSYIEPAVRGFYRSIHYVCGHVIDFTDADHATGTVYCRAEHEDGGKWVVMAICYFDIYERRGGAWYFVCREEQHWYTHEIQDRPGDMTWQNWPGKANGPREQPTLPHRFPTWTPFWLRAGDKARAQVTATP
jgi:hypothetical protein